MKVSRFTLTVLVDVWEPGDAGDSGEAAGEPVVFHGGTLTGKIPVSEALKVIAEMGFERTRSDNRSCPDSSKHKPSSGTRCLSAWKFTSQ